MRAFDASHPFVWDVAFALLVALACTSASVGLRPVGAPFLLIACGAVALRRRAPLLALAVASVALSTGIVVCGFLGEAPPWGHLAIWILLFHVGLRRRRALASAAALAGVVALAAFAGAAEPDQLALDERGSALLPVAAMSAVALLAGSQSRGTREAEQRHRDEATRAAVAAERSRISREMHDLIGHDLSVIASLSAGGQNVVRSSPEEAERAFAAIGEVSRASVGQLRHALRLLRAADDERLLPLAPQPGLSQLGALIGAVRDAGLHVDDERRGDLQGLPPGHQLAVYRIVQEALTNTLRHGGGGAAVRVRVAVDARDVVVTIADSGAVPEADRPAASGYGHGILGMRERVEALGGALEVGSTAAGWLVRAVIPMEGRVG
ncbi:sensor histidine kinase [Nocardiopsis sp. CA-288880]|uniref:sensor histidine kinase n=1 Tax=Nocardiopsis sp. CA-288880 TaxID=3239995 RepID=UPI003D9943EE